MGIGYRPATGNDGSRGVLYGLGEAGGVYTLDRNARATKRSQLSFPLQGQSFGVDFVDLDAYASLTSGGRARFYEISLLQGRATSQGSFAPRNQVTGIAIPLNRL